jgi:hypothetical protein
VAKINTVEEIEVILQNVFSDLVKKIFSGLIKRYNDESRGVTIEQIDVFLEYQEETETVAISSLYLHKVNDLIVLDNDSTLMLTLNMPKFVWDLFRSYNAYKFSRLFVKDALNPNAGWRFSISWAANVNALFVAARYLVPKDKNVPDTLVNNVLEGLEEGGLTLIGGDFKQGKTTLAYSIIRKWMKLGGRHAAVSTLEDPIEQVLGIPARQRDIPERYWKDYIPIIVREGSSLVFFGEISTPETAYVLAQYAVTGLPTLATIHASKPGMILSRFAELVKAAAKNEYPVDFISQTIYVKLIKDLDGQVKQLVEYVNWNKLRKEYGISIADLAYSRGNYSEIVYNNKYRTSKAIITCKDYATIANIQNKAAVSHCSD